MEESNVSFARMFRPDSLDGYVGNQKIKDTIFSNLKKGKERPQSILISGTTGSGKTTLARILAREYRCLDRSDETGACGKCEECKLITDYIKTGNSEYLQDVQEVDITDKSGKDAIGELIEEMQYPSIDGGWKVYILDESHLLSPAAGSRLLPQIEEPEPGVLVMFCTTDPERMLDTLRNRAQRKFNIQKASLNEISALLAGICREQGVRWDREGLRLIISRSDFIIRESLNLLEQVIQTQGEVTGKAVSDEFNEVSDQLVFEFIEAYLNKDQARYISTLYKIKTKFGFENFYPSLRTLLSRAVYVYHGIAVEGLSPSEIETYKQLFNRFSQYELGTFVSNITNIDTRNLETELMLLIVAPPEPISKGFDKPVAGITPGENPQVKTSKQEAAHRYKIKAEQEADQIKKSQKKMAETKQNVVGIADVSELFGL